MTRRPCVRWGPSSLLKSDTARTPLFGPCLLWQNGWMDQDASCYEGRPRPRLHCVTWGPSSPQKGHSSPILFGPCLLWPNGRPSWLLRLSTCFSYLVNPFSICYSVYNFYVYIRCIIDYANSVLFYILSIHC